MCNMLYFDNAATTYPKPECVYQKMDEVNRGYAVNAGRGSYAVAKAASNIIEEVRSELLSLTNGKEVAEVVLTPSATIALNQIIGGMTFTEHSVVYVSPYEHNAVARTLCMHVKKENIIELPLKKNSLELDIEQTKYLFSVTPPTHMFISHVSNVTGYILPINELTTIAKEYGAVTVVDASQSLGLVEIDLTELNADFVVFAGHKTVYGPFGTGGFFKKKDAALNVFLAGGTGSDSLNTDMPQQGSGRFEPASQNIVALAGLLAALQFLKNKSDTKTYKDSVRENYLQEVKITELLIQGLSEIEEVKLYTESDQSTYHQVGIVAFNIEGYKASDVGMILDEDYNIAVRTGYHCAPFVHEYLNDKNYVGVVRASIGQFTTKEDVKKFVEAIGEIAEG